MKDLIGLTPEVLRRAANIQEKILELREALNQLLGNGRTPEGDAPKAKRKMSAAGRAAIRAAQKARWAKVGTGKPKAGNKAKKKMSPAAKAKLAALLKARWAKARKAGKSTL
jgi:hypothetical protein